MNLLREAAKMLIESGRVGIAPSKKFRSISRHVSDEFAKTSVGPWKPLNKLFANDTALRRGRLHNHSGIFPLMLFSDKSNISKFSRIFKIFGNPLMLQPDKNNLSKFGGMSEFELKLGGDILLPERSTYNKCFREEKRVKSIG